MDSAAAGPLVEETEVVEKAKRRRFTAQEKRRILDAADRCIASGETGGVAALLRREGLYSSHLATWRQARDRGELAGLEPKKRGPRKKVLDARDLKIAALEKEMARMEVRARKAEAIIDLQKKVSEILGIQLPEHPPEKD